MMLRWRRSLSQTPRTTEDPTEATSEPASSSASPPRLSRDGSRESEPRVSVCLLAFNHEEFISQAIESVLAQVTDFEVELIIGEDDSTDRTRSIVQRFATEHPDRIRLLLNTRDDVIEIDGVVTGRRNLLNTLAHARGRYVALLDGDDYWSDPHKLQEQVRFLESGRDFSGVFHDTDVVDHTGRNTDPGRWFRDYSARDTIEIDDMVSLVTPFHTSSFLFRRACLELPPEFNDYLTGDIPIYLVVASKGPIGHLKKPMSVYRRHATGVSSAAHRRRHAYFANRLFMFRSLQRHLAPLAAAGFEATIRDCERRIVETLRRQPAAVFARSCRDVAKRVGAMTFVRLLVRTVPRRCLDVVLPGRRSRLRT
jgi:glycosyltransferase involved in cell wall biosynthesis